MEEEKQPTQRCSPAKQQILQERYRHEQVAATLGAQHNHTWEHIRKSATMVTPKTKIKPRKLDTADWEAQMLKNE